MKGCLIFILSIVVILLCGVVAYLALRQPEVRDKLVYLEVEGETGTTPVQTSSNNKEQGQLALLVEKVTELLEKDSDSNSDSSVSPDTPEKKTFNQYWDADEAFAEDELFAITSKRTIPRESYTDVFYKGPFTKYHREVYIVRAMGRETRENYLFIVPMEFYSHAKIYQKFTKAEMSNFEYFLSEKKLEREVFSRRFHRKMVD